MDESILSDGKVEEIEENVVEDVDENISNEFVIVQKDNLPNCDTIIESDKIQELKEYDVFIAPEVIGEDEENVNIDSICVETPQKFTPTETEEIVEEELDKLSRNEHNV